jgi:hypothetical protein
MAVLELTLPMPEIASNRRHGKSRHWRAVERDKTAYWAQLDELQLFKRIPPPPARPFAKATLRSTMYLGAAMDEDNAVHRHKWVIDWLRTRGYLVSDRRTCLRWEGFPDQVIKRDGDYRLVLTLTSREVQDGGPQ